MSIKGIGILLAHVICCHTLIELFNLQLHLVNELLLFLNLIDVFFHFGKFFNRASLRVIEVFVSDDSNVLLNIILNLGSQRLNSKLHAFFNDLVSLTDFLFHLLLKLPDVNTERS
jgi:hypothetical protein